MDEQVAAFLPVLMFLVGVVGFVGAAMVVTHFFPKPRKPTPVKDMPYESGRDPDGDARRRFDVKFYLVAVLFLVFDVELLFLYPWAAAYSEGTITGPDFANVVLVEVLLFPASVVVAYDYAWRKGVFPWR